MKHLRALDLRDNSLPAGIADILGQLSRLTSLSMRSVQPESQWYAAARQRPVVLPSLQCLWLKGEGALQFLAGTYAPLLTQLPHLELPLGTPLDQAHLLSFTAGVLHLCPDIRLDGQGREVAAAELGSVLSALSAAWQCFPCQGRKALSLSYFHCPQSVLALTPGSVTSLSIL
jgi:hypothetical protein